MNLRLSILLVAVLVIFGGTFLVVRFTGPGDPVSEEPWLFRLDDGATLDLAAIAAVVPGADYDPARLAGVVMRLDEPSASFILFRSGIVVVTAVSSETRARSALKALSKFLHAASLIG